MITLRWAAYVIAILCLVALAHGRSLPIVIVLALAILAVFASFGAFSRRVWFGTPEQEAECARIDEELSAEERRTRT